jgi:hypothetical protein
VMKDGPTMVLFDENSIIRLMAGKSDLGSSIGTRVSYPESSIVLFGPDGKVTWSVPKLD